MIKEIKTSRIKAKLDKSISRLVLTETYSNIWLRVGDRTVGSYYRGLGELSFDIQHFMVSCKIEYSREVYDLLKDTLHTKLYDIFKDKNITNIKFI